MNTQKPGLFQNGSASSVKEKMWPMVSDYLFILVGSLVQALAMRLFLIPGKLVSGGISGAAQLINHYTAWPIGLMVIIGNIPLFLLGWRYLGGRRFAFRTAFTILAFSILTDALVWIIPPESLANDPVLSSLFGGVLLGFGLGLVYRGKGTSGGSDIIGRIINHRLGIPISQSYLITDAVIVLSAGFVFGWEYALYGLVMLYVSGVAAEVTLEGTGIFRTVMIVTSCPQEIAQEIMTSMERGVTFLNGKGAYTGQEREVIYSVVTRSEISRLKALVQEKDPGAFMVIGQAHEALGEGFRPLKH